MKILLAIFAITFINLNGFAQHNLTPDLQSPQSDYFILDSFYHWGWDTLAFQWNLKDRTLYATDAKLNVISELAIVKDSLQQWANSTLITHTFDAENHETNEVDQLWDGTAWVNNIQDVYTFDGNDNQTGVTVQNWTGTEWANSFQQVFTFDNSHNQLTRTSQYWTGTAWADVTRQISTYNANNKLTLRLYQNYNGGWNDVSRSLYTYDAPGDLDTLLYQKWTFNAWNDDYRNIYDYDAHHNRKSIFAQLALGINVWQDRDRYDYTYDQYNHITHLIYTKNEGNTWYNNYQYNLINDENQNRATEVFQTWNNGWVNVDSTQYYYTGITGINDLYDHELITVTPNPASDFIFVDYPRPIDGSIAIYSVQGAKLLEFKSLHEQSFRINVASLLPGIYFVAIRVGNHIQTSGFEKY
jgi:hypothetical protein